MADPDAPILQVLPAASQNQLVCPAQVIDTIVTDVLAVPVLEMRSQLPAAAPHVKVTPALPERKSPDFKNAAVTATWAEPCAGVVEFVIVVVEIETRVVVIVAVAVDVETSGLPELIDDSCSSTIPKADPQTPITITVAAAGLVTPGLALGNLRPVISFRSDENAPKK